MTPVGDPKRLCTLGTKLDDRVVHPRHDGLLVLPLPTRKQALGRRAALPGCLALPAGRLACRRQRQPVEPEYQLVGLGRVALGPVLLEPLEVLEVGAGDADRLGRPVLGVVLGRGVVLDLRSSLRWVARGGRAGARGVRGSQWRTRRRLMQVCHNWELRNKITFREWDGWTFDMSRELKKQRWRRKLKKKRTVFFPN